mmetsp:Transcript_72037/g.206769  ORF Transcript_72037/g.206769 Transcript_72037/m.206769 type:complete len:516 (+) Transcript_72037:70-1617(+)|eukprot:CAMPEP_0177374064 /NCGR_PEP_ID=MMETSP0368-20130122/43958_1 /TAXON_ID=447022 ORGANISM="Scrippsiella hangoei-like, Strain SHHI-4" /NCGR_SAMPLE_ID=MMETSP0368 /ASSEMBLY_ACC=CAM_ASM_000363 /LENGTH=515 /DNA_ID=CAMNT_0018837635 /DNA_START=7 /DNA_END=1554 /DNA_ORIENTATION=-
MAAALLDVFDAYTWPALAVTALALLIAAAALRARKPAELEVGAGGAYASRDFVTHEDLVDAKIRGNHLAFNAHLHQRFAGQRVIPVRGEEGCYIAFSYAACKDAMNDHTAFSSNPFPDNRLVALNTMAKADHTRVLRYVHSSYRQEDIDSLDERILSVIERCTDELESAAAGEGGDVVRWAKRIHMASTLARLGVDWVPGDGGDAPSSWAKVDEVIDLNDAMVALVAPLGGVGRRYSTLPRWQWLQVFLGIVRSVPPTLLMAWRLGISCTWEIVRPDVTVLFPPSRPRMGLWWRPELLPLVPRYCLALHELLQVTPDGSEGPLPGIRQGVLSGDLQLAEALTLLVQLMVNMTSANVLCNMVFRLASERAAAAEVAAKPELSSAFVQEVLRLDAPLQRNPRRVAKAPGAKWKETELQAGNQVLLFLGAANMDPTVFENPSEFLLNRTGEKGTALSFGSGMHYCLGSNLVKSEMRLALECLVRRFSSVAVVAGYRRLDDVDVGNYGFRSLRVKLATK